MRRHFFALLVIAACFGVSAQARDKISLNQGWKFIRQDVPAAVEAAFDDSEWQTVNLPHDAVIYQKFQKEGDGATRRNGFLPLGQGTYRRHIAYDKAWDGRRVVLEFEGVYRKARVWINGKLCSDHNPNGYIDFGMDITDCLRDGDNVVTVSYDNRYENSSRWYNGEGINRDVWLHVLDPVHIARYGTYITTPRILPDRATVAVETKVVNERPDSVICQLVTDIYAPTGEKVASATSVAPFAPGETFVYHQNINVTDPQLWEVGNGRMYRAESRVTAQGGYPAKTDVDANATPNDVYSTPFGIRDIEFTPEQGLLVNGKRVYINGVCLHTDLGPLGTASFAAAWERRLNAVRDSLSCNGLRLSHNCYPKYVLEWADRNGMLVVDEFFDKWADSYYGQGAKLGGDKPDDMQLRDIRVQMERDRNHPSVFIWSVGNEVYQQIQNELTHKEGVQMLKKVVDYTRSIDPSRKTTYSQYPNRYGSMTHARVKQGFKNFEPHPFQFYTDVVSTNYLEGFWDRDHKKYPQLVFMGGELSVDDLGYSYFNYDHSYPVGHFYWGGTDYIGESFGWPQKGWIRGLLDLTNHLKPAGQSVRSFHSSDPMVHIVVRPGTQVERLTWNDLKIKWTKIDEHWNYAAGDTVEVQVMSNCDETDLLLNGRSLGRLQLPPKDKAPYLTWRVPYEKGELRAVGYNKGEKVAETTLRTAGRPARVIATLDRDSISADGLDLAYIDYTVVDRHGNVCKTSDVDIEFRVEGPGINAGVASSDLFSDEPWQSNRRRTHEGRAQLIVRSTTDPGTIRVIARPRGLKPVTTTIASAH